MLGKHLPDKPNTLIIANRNGHCSGTQQGQTLHCKRWTSIIIVLKVGGAIAQRGRSLLSTIALFRTAIFRHFYIRATRRFSAVHAVALCPSVCLSQAGVLSKRLAYHHANSVAR